MYKERSPAEKKNAGGIIEILPAAFLLRRPGAGFVGLWTAIENIRQDFSGGLGHSPTSGKDIPFHCLQILRFGAPR